MDVLYTTKQVNTNVSNSRFKYNIVYYIAV